MPKKHLELCLIRSLLTKNDLLECAIQYDNTVSFLYLLKEFKASFRDNLFENNERANKMFSIINKNGNLVMLKEVFKFDAQSYASFIE